jgi:hypothetical protein
VLRGGYGLFNFHDEQGPFAGLMDVPAGHQNTTVAQNLTLSDIQNIVPAATRPTVNAVDPNDDKQPRSQSWSLTIQRRLPWSLTVESSYVGTYSDQLRNDGLSNINIVPFGAMLNDPDGNADAYRPYLLYGGINLIQHSLYSNYHSWQNLVSRLSGNFSFTASYTLSKALGIRGGIYGPAAYPPGDQTLRQTNYGVLNIDRRHVFSLAYSWLFPEVGSGVANAVLGNWQISGISQFVSGAPLQAARGSNFALDGTLADGTQISATRITGSPDIPAQPFLTCDPRGSGDVYLNAACFAPPTPGNNGNYIFPNAQSPWYTNHDISLFKNFPFGNERKFQFRLSAYNVFNHPQRYLDDTQNLDLTYTNGVQTNAGFGILPEDNKYGRRIIQLAFKFYF